MSTGKKIQGNKHTSIKVSEIIKASDKIKKRNYHNRMMLKEADEHYETQIRLDCYNAGINELLKELGLRGK